MKTAGPPVFGSAWRPLNAQNSGVPAMKPGKPSTVPLPGNETLIVDAAVPISRYPEMIVFPQKLVDENKAFGYVFGHAGDGNLHVVLVGDPDDEKQWSKLELINDQIVTRTVKLGGTCTGEHGIGIGKRKFMALEHGQSDQLMRQIKQLIDPEGLLNPG